MFSVSHGWACALVRHSAEPQSCTRIGDFFCLEGKFCPTTVGVLLSQAVQRFNKDPSCRVRAVNCGKKGASMKAAVCHEFVEQSASLVACGLALTAYDIAGHETAIPYWF